MTMSTIEQQVNCSTCTWNKFCITPPVMTKAEVDATLKKDLDKAKDKEGDGGLLGAMLGGMLLAGKDTECHVCPVFAAKLRETAELSTKIKELMKSM